MKHFEKNNNEKPFLEQQYSKNSSQHHKKYLGTEIPEGYFATSKLAILERIKQEEIIEKPKKQLVFWLQPRFKYAVAASLLLMFGLSFWFQNFNKSEEKITIDADLLTFSDDVLLNAILVDDAQLESFSTIALVNEIVIKAELSEQKMDELFLNSIFVEDSLIDDYTDKKFIESIIL